MNIGGEKIIFIGKFISYCFHYIFNLEGQKIDIFHD